MTERLTDEQIYTNIEFYEGLPHDEHQAIYSMAVELQQSRAEIERLRGALKFFSDSHNYTERSYLRGGFGDANDPKNWYLATQVHKEGRDRAWKALQGATP